MCGDCLRAAADLNSVQKVQIFPEINGSARTQIRAESMRAVLRTQHP